MDEKAKTAIFTMLSSFPQWDSKNYDAALHGFDIACDGSEDGAIVHTAYKFLKGDVERQSKSRPPSTAEFKAQLDVCRGLWVGHRRLTSDEIAERTRLRRIEDNKRLISQQTRRSEPSEESKRRVEELRRKVTTSMKTVPEE